MRQMQFSQWVIYFILARSLSRSFMGNLWVLYSVYNLHSVWNNQIATAAGSSIVLNFRLSLFHLLVFVLLLLFFFIVDFNSRNRITIVVNE